MAVLGGGRFLMSEVPLYDVGPLLHVTLTSHPYMCRGTSLIRNSPLVGPYSRTMSRALWWPWGGGVFLISEVLL